MRMNKSIIVGILAGLLVTLLATSRKLRLRFSRGAKPNRS